MPKDRGIEHANRQFDMSRLIDEKLRRKKKIRILDAGCGYGVAMIEIAKKYGDRVEVHGFLDNSNCGNQNIMKEQAVIKGVYTRDEIKKARKFPTYHFFDGSNKWPLPSNYFDIIYSMAAIYLVDDKVNFLQEANRVLAKNGVARISSPVPKVQWEGKRLRSHKQKGYPKWYYNYYEVWNNGKEVEFHEYIKKFRGVKVELYKNKVKGRNYIEIKKQPKLDLKLRLVASIDYNFLWKEWQGVKSIYTTQLSFKPNYKKDDKYYLK
ncbi:MAG: class I SAM-dependent methyltransferase [Nanoarchaeota archaeon]